MNAANCFNTKQPFLIWIYMYIVHDDIVHNDIVHNDIVHDDTACTHSGACYINGFLVYKYSLHCMCLFVYY